MYEEARDDEEIRDIDEVMVPADEVGVRLPRPFALAAYRDDDAELPTKMLDGMILDDGSVVVHGVQPNGRSFTGRFRSVATAADRLDAIPVRP